jgi:hypothetical protein
LYAIRGKGVVTSPQSSQLEIGSSIKGDVNKKTSPSAGSREVFCLDIQPTVAREVVVCGFIDIYPVRGKISRQLSFLPARLYRYLLSSMIATAL